MKQLLTLWLLLLTASGIRARQLHLVVRPAVASVKLLSYDGLHENAATFLLKGDSATLPVPVSEGLLVIALPGGQLFPLWVEPGSTDYRMELRPQSPVPRIDGSPLTEKLYREMAVLAGLSQRRTVLATALRGLPDTARLKKLIQEEQGALGKEADSTIGYWQSRLSADPVALLLWGNRILPEGAGALTQQGQDALAKARILQFVAAHYEPIAKTDLLRNLVIQYLGVTEAAGYPQGSPTYEARSRADIKAWTAALQTRYSASEVTNHIIGVFLQKSMWTLCDTLMKNNPDAFCAVPASAGPPVPLFRDAVWRQGFGDSLYALDAGKTNVLLAVYDMSCPAAAMEYILMRRQLQEGYRLPVAAGFVLLNQPGDGFRDAWQGMPATVYHYTGTGRPALPEERGVPAYWIATGSGLRYLGRSYRDVKAYFETTGGKK